MNERDRLCPGFVCRDYKTVQDCQGRQRALAGRVISYQQGGVTHF